MPKVNTDALDDILNDMAEGHSSNERDIFGSAYEINKIITDLNSSSAYDSHDISTKYIKELRGSNNFIAHLTKLWNYMAHFEIFPDALKKDKIIYIWKKKGNRSEANFYRPITLVIAISKIMEGMLNRKVNFNIKSPIQDDQHAYIPGKSMVTAILDLEEKIVNLKTTNFGVVFIDLKGAFESVSHDLIQKFYSLSNRKLGNFCKSYLSNRMA